MGIKHLTKSLAILVLGLFATASYAAGQITGVSAPTSAVSGTLITIIMADVSGPLIRRPSPRKQQRASPIKRQPRRRSTPTLNKRQPTASRPVTSTVMVMCQRRRATIVGTPGSDRILGTPGNDVIHGLGGNDSIDGRGGDDIICGGSGYDALKGGDGNDKLYGGPDNDNLYGESGNDVLSGGSGNDVLSGGSGNDGFSGGSGNDRCEGGHGTDSADSTCEIQSSIP